MTEKKCLNCGKEHKRDSAFCCPYCKGSYLAKQGQPKRIGITQADAMGLHLKMVASKRRRRIEPRSKD